MPEHQTQALAQRAVPSLRAVGYTVLLALVLAWPAVIRSGAFFFPDSASYVKGGAAAFQVVGAIGDAVVSQPGETNAIGRGADAVIDEVREEVVGLRSVTYSVFAYLMFLASESLLSLVFAQALLIAVLVTIFLHVQLIHVTHTAYLSLILLLGAATSAPWYTSFAMPDIFGAATILGVILLAAYGPWLNMAQRTYIAVLVAFAVSAHTSNMLLAVPMTLAGVVELWRQARTETGHKNWDRYMWLTAPIALGVIATMLIGAIGFGEPSAVPKRYPSCSRVPSPMAPHGGTSSSIAPNISMPSAKSSISFQTPCTISYGGRRACGTTPRRNRWNVFALKKRLLFSAPSPSIPMYRLQTPP